MDKTQATSARVLPTNTPELFRAAVIEAARILRAGELVALPTETVYGLAANALNAAAVRRIFEVKGRPSRNPIIVHITGARMARQCVRQWPETAARLAKAFWPGPLTLVLPRAVEIPDMVTAGGDTVGVRWPNHPVFEAVLRECAFPLAAPSANLSNRLSPTSAEHVRHQLGSRISLILDGGACHVGIESTVLDLTATPPRVLRPGMIGEQSLLAVLTRLAVGTGGAEVLKSPGQLPRHYSPRAKLLVRSWRDAADLLQSAAALGVSPERACVVAHTRIPSGAGWLRVSVIPHDPAAYARALYGELHQCDETGAEAIIVEAVPHTGAWRAIADRLARAAA